MSDMPATPRPTRRLVVGGALATPVFAVAPARAKGPRAPNILFILADDLGYADLSCYGRPDFQTPVLDTLAGQGVRLTQAYANSCVCSASRIALITGRYQYRLRAGLEEPIARSAKSSAVIGLPPGEPTLPALLKAGGYGTTLIGKWHMGFPPHFGPLKSGYDHFFGVHAGGVDYFTHKDDVGGRGDGLYDDEVPVERHGYLTDLLADRAVETITRAAAGPAPFLLSLHFTAPHWPWEGPQDEAESRRLKRDLFDWDGGGRDTYAAMVLSLDRAIGRVLRALDDSGAAADTIVVFTSDNGGERFSDVWPFSGQKTELLEGGLRVPAIVRWPGRIAPGSPSSQVAISMDWAPTLLAAAGVNAQRPFDGENLLPGLTGGAPDHDRRLFWRYRANSQSAVRDADWKYLRIRDNEFLFDLARDPRERANLKDREPAVFARLKQSWAEWNETMLPQDPSSYSDRVDGSRLADHYGARTED